MQIQVTRKRVGVFSTIITLFLIGFLLGSTLAQVPAGTPQSFSRGPYITSTHYVWTEGGYTYCKDAYGAPTTKSGSPNASDVITQAISYGGTVYLNGTFTLTTPIAIDNTVTITGGDMGGDLFFTRDGTYNGFKTKWATVLIANGTDAFQIGINTFCFGVTIQNLGITGKDCDDSAGPPTGGVTAGCGINISRGDTIKIFNVEVTHKSIGIGIDTGSFAWDHVCDVLNIEHCIFTYNTIGISSAGWLANSRFNYIWGYINDKNLLKLTLKYDIVIENVFSNADGQSGITITDAPIYILTQQDCSLWHVAVYGCYGSALCPMPLMVLSPMSAGSPEWYRGHFKLNDITLFETESDAIQIPIDAIGQIDIIDIHAGSSGTQGFAGGDGNITGSIINNKAGLTNVNVYVDYGFVNSLQTGRDISWFINCTKIGPNLNNFNPLGFLRPFSTAKSTIGLGGGDTVQASKNYTIAGTDVTLNCTGGTGVSITIYAKDNGGSLATVESGLTALSWRELKVGEVINFGGFSGAPTTITLAP
jgi:hypothetical protein